MSKRSGKSGVCSCCGEHKRFNGNLIGPSFLDGNPEGREAEKADSILSKSNKSAASTSNAHENCEPVNNMSEGKVTRERSESARSKISNGSSTSKISKKSKYNEEESVEERTKSATPAKSVGSDCIVSEREPTPALEMDKAEEKSQERAVSPMSAHSNLSAASRTSHKSKSQHSEKAKMPRSCSPNDLEEVPSNIFNSQGDISESAATQSHTMTDNHCGQDTEFPQEVRSASAMSNKSNRSSEHPSNASEQTTKSVKSCCDLQEKATQNACGPDVQCEPETEVITEERLCSPLSNCSKISVKSHASSKNSHAESKSKERVPSAMSVKTNTSKGSSRCYKSNHNVPETRVTSEPNNTTPNECATPESESNRATCSMSKTTEKSNAYSERSGKYTAKSQVSKEVENGKDMTPNTLAVTSPLPRSKRSPSPRSNRSPSPRSTHNTEIKKTESRASSGLSVSSNVSPQSQRSSKCYCLKSSSGNLKETKTEMLKEDAKDESESLSGKSKLSAKSLINKIKSAGNQFDEPLSPTSTASVSLGLGEEHKGDDFERSTSCMSATIEDVGHMFQTVNGVDAEERPRTEMSMNSAISDKSKRSHHKNCKTTVQALSAESIISAEPKKSKSGIQLNENDIRVPSTLCSRSKSPSRVSQGSAKNTVMIDRDCEAVNNTNHAEMKETYLKHDQSEITTGKAMPESKRLNSSKTSEHSVKYKNGHSTKESDISKCKISKCSSKCLEINGLIIKYNGDYDGATVKTFASDRTSMKNYASRPNSAGMSEISQNCISLPQEMPNKNKTPLKHPGSSNDIVLSRALSAADLLKEIARPVSKGSKSVASSKNFDKVENKSQKSSRSKHSKVSISSECKNKELMPSCLPNASPTDVVNDWLRNIPSDGHVYEMDIELT